MANIDISLETIYDRLLDIANRVDKQSGELDRIKSGLFGSVPMNPDAIDDTEELNGYIYKIHGLLGEIDTMIYDNDYRIIDIKSGVYTQEQPVSVKASYSENTGEIKKINHRR